MIPQIWLEADFIEWTGALKILESNYIFLQIKKLRLTIASISLYSIVTWEPTISALWYCSATVVLHPHVESSMRLWPAFYSWGLNMGLDTQQMLRKFWNGWVDGWMDEWMEWLAQGHIVGGGRARTPKTGTSSVLLRPLPRGQGEGVST